MKAATMAQNVHLVGLKTFAEEYTVKHKILVTNDPCPGKMKDMMVMHRNIFLEKSWVDELIS
ncbi:MAG: hypothetical protein EOM06_12285 [Sphingobacteriia bacterium]|nr:hypothetical protein [Sphingobacteriia bacterium]